MSEYSKLKVTELKELLEKRGLATTGKKDDLISRLTAADAEAQTGTEAKVEAHLAPPEDEFDWEGDLDDGTKKDTGDAAAAPASTTTTAAAAGVEQPGQTADEVKTTEGASAAGAAAAAAATESDAGASTTTDATAAAAAAPAAEEKPKEDFSAHLSATKVSDELEKRKARAARFGITVDDSVKLLERGLRFSSGTEGASSEGDSKVVKGLDEALGDGRGRKRGHGGQGGGGHDNKGGNDRKRSRGNDGGNQRRQQGQGQQGGGRQQQQQRGGGGGGGGGQSKPKGIMTDPVEKAKAEARAKRFGGS